MTKNTSTIKNFPSQQIELSIGDVKSSIVSYTEEQLLERIKHARLVFVDSSIQFLRNSEAMGTHIIFVPGGERAKSKVIFEAILDSFFQKKIVRGDTVMAMGGGAVCDVVSYAASTYMRGIKIVLVPSTLLSMVDASIGGKTAINYRGLKNMLGSFHLASEVLIATHILTSVSTRQKREGLAEIIKAGMLRNSEILSLIESKGKSLIVDSYAKNEDMWHRLIWKSIQVKVDIVQADFKEKNIRALLNLGHTFAHAHEFCANTSTSEPNLGNVSHGEAVGLGIRAALQLGLSIFNDKTNNTITDEVYATRIFTLLDELEYPNSYKGYSSEKLLEAMTMDKKRSAHLLQFVFQSKSENTMIYTVAPAKVKSVLQILGAK